MGVFVLRGAFVFCVLAALVTGCAKPPASSPNLSAFAPRTDPVVTSAIDDAVVPRPQASHQPLPLRPGVSLAGRTLTVANNAQLILRPREVVLTFDDGPRPGKTEAILATLREFGVKATFLMLGESAEHHPGLVRAVAQAGHTIGTHTYGHVNLTSLSPDQAMAEIYAGHAAVANALETIGETPSRFFRFPYLAQTGVIRANAIGGDFIILDVDIDSKDYYKDTPEVVMNRALARLDAAGQGVILFHDIHARTVAMLPEFLRALQARGYKVVTLRSSGGNVFTTPLVTAHSPAIDAAL